MGSVRVGIYVDVMLRPRKRWLDRRTPKAPYVYRIAETLVGVAMGDCGIGMNGADKFQNGVGGAVHCAGGT